MRRLCFVILLLCCFCSGVSAGKGTDYPGSEQLKAAAQRGMEEILELWRSERYDELYLRTTGSRSRESFTGTLSASRRRPTCCWDRMQGVSLKVKNDSTVVINARFGFELPGGEVEFVTKPLKVVKEEGVWKVSQVDLLSMAGEGRKKKK